MRERSERGSAIAVGALYIAATVAGVLSKVVSGSSLLGPLRPGHLRRPRNERDAGGSGGVPPAGQGIQSA
jgi:hypothetical protein